MSVQHALHRLRPTRMPALCCYLPGSYPLFSLSLNSWTAWRSARGDAICKFLSLDHLELAWRDCLICQWEPCLHLEGISSPHSDANISGGVTAMPLIWGQEKAITGLGDVLCPSGGGEGWRPPTAHAAAQRRLAFWLRWLLADLVVPLVRAHFYCTESEAYRQQVFYYRHVPTPPAFACLLLLCPSRHLFVFRFTWFIFVQWLGHGGQ